jgi:hypothetical protein
MLHSLKGGEAGFHGANEQGASALGVDDCRNSRFSSNWVSDDLNP